MLFFVCLLVALGSCNLGPDEKLPPVILKHAANDPFAESMVESQFFELDASTADVVEGTEGIVIVTPKGCFKNSKGEIVDGNVTIELAEALERGDMIMSNLTTTSGTELLETGGMFYFNATADGEQLTINPDIPIYVEVPAADRKEGMMVYEGVRDSVGNVDWVRPRSLAKFLMPVDMELLDFYPDGFEEAVAAGLPILGHTEPSKAFIDSLYFSLQHELQESDLRVVAYKSYNEPFASGTYEVENGKYTSESYVDSLDAEDVAEADSIVAGQPCGINPATIKVLRGREYANTFIATREFQQRLKLLFEYERGQELVELYVNNLDRDLWEIDAMVAERVSNNQRWEAMASERLTNVRGAEKYAAALQGHFDKRLKRVTKKLDAARAKLKKALAAKDEAAKKLVEEYTEVLWEREEHRMEAYGFEWTTTGWANVDKPAPAVVLEKVPIPVDLDVTNGASFDRVHAYLVFEAVESIYRLESITKQVHTIGGGWIPVWKEKELSVMVVGYKDGTAYAATSTLPLKLDPVHFEVTLVKRTRGEIKRMMKRYSGAGKENSIERDLGYMAAFAAEQSRQQHQYEIDHFVWGLRDVAFPGCSKGELWYLGQQLFEGKCTACHRISKPLTGPPLAGVTNKYSMDWIVRFTQNASEMINSGDPEAVAAFNAWNNTAMTAYPELDEQDVRAIFEYVDQCAKSR